MTELYLKDELCFIRIFIYCEGALGYPRAQTEEKSANFAGFSFCLAEREH